MLKVGSIIPKGSSVRLVWNVAQIPGVETAAALQSFCITDYFRVKAEVAVIRGGAGTGKSFARDRIVAKLKKRNIDVLCVALTGWSRNRCRKECGKGRCTTLRPWLGSFCTCQRPKSLLSAFTSLLMSTRWCRPPTLTNLDHRAATLPNRPPDAYRRSRADVAGARVAAGSSSKLKKAQTNDSMVVYRLVAQKRYGECERMVTLIQALRSGMTATANAELYRLATKAPPTTGSCRLVAATHALAKPANDRMHAALATQPGRGADGVYVRFRRRRSIDSVLQRRTGSNLH